MSYLAFLALRQLQARPWQSALLVLSVSLGVAILTTALSLTNGFEKDLVDRLLGTSPHVSIHEPLTGRLEHHQALARQLAGRRHVRAVTPYVQGQGLIATEAKTTVGVLVRGVDPVREAATPGWRRYLRAGSLPPGGLVLGSEVARKLGLAQGDRAWLVTGLGLRRGLTVTGIFESGLYDFDAHVAMVTLEEAQRAFGLGRAVSGLGVTLDDVFEAAPLAEAWSREFEVGTRAWTEQNRPLLQAMFLERVVIFIVILFIVLVAMMGVGSTMAMWVIEKNRELSLLRAIGASAREAGRLFVLQGTIISGVGVVLGSLGGVLLSSLLAVFPLQLAGEVYFLSRLPVDMHASDFVTVALVTLLLSPVASLLPAWRAMRLDPIEVIRRT
ncbi:MAG: ABC transporter permease [Candidatus Sericytochromatia bacterium]|nr:ABC transporter permease [Candidatus Sericytochromatia bacterium]